MASGDLQLLNIICLAVIFLGACPLQVTTPECPGDMDDNQNSSYTN